MVTVTLLPVDLKRDADGKVVRHGEPVWEPLLRKIGERGTANWMFMGSYELVDGTIVRSYKHQGTRQYLYLTDNGEEWLYYPEQPRFGKIVNSQITTIH